MRVVLVEEGVLERGVVVGNLDDNYLLLWFNRSCIFKCSTKVR